MLLIDSVTNLFNSVNTGYYIINGRVTIEKDCNSYLILLSFVLLIRAILFAVTDKINSEVSTSF